MSLLSFEFTRTASASGVASDRLLMPPNRKRPVVRYVAIFRTARPWSCTRVYGFELFAPHACIRAAGCIQPLRAAQSSARQCCGRCHDHTPQIRTMRMGQSAQRCDIALRGDWVRSLFTPPRRAWRFYSLSLPFTAWWSPEESKDRYATVTHLFHVYRYLRGTWARLCHIASRYLPVALRYKTSIFAYIPRDMYAEGNSLHCITASNPTTPLHSLWHTLPGRVP